VAAFLFGFAQIPAGPEGNYSVSAEGIIKKAGTTSYMYGTHILINADGKTLYALKSDNLKLDDFVGKKVTVKGELVQGYPVDFGPNFLNVMRIE
jgi:hypothetical protein